MAIFCVSVREREREREREIETVPFRVSVKECVFVAEPLYVLFKCVCTREREREREL